LHTNHLSENVFLARTNCTRDPRPKEVGGYIREVSSRHEAKKKNKSPKYFPGELWGVVS
jgi:hypothetical protein